MTDAPHTIGSTPAPERRRGITALFVAVLPLLAFAGIAVLCYVRLGADVAAIPSPLIGKPPPPFALPAIDQTKAADAAAKPFTNADLRTGGVTLVNFFGSYCEPCKHEQGVLMQLAGDKRLALGGLKVAGIAWKDKTPATRRFLDVDGNPFAIVGADVSGRTGIDWGITGVPETYIVKGDGTIAYKFVGEMTDETVAATILPQIENAAK